MADTARVNELAAYSESGIAGSVYYSGSSSQDVARTPMAGRSMLDCQREVARTIGGIIFAARDGNLVLARSDAYWRSTVGTYLMLGDDDDLSVGDIVWDDGVDQAPSMVSASWPGGTAVAEAATVEAGAERDLQIRPRPSRMPRPSRRRVPDPGRRVVVSAADQPRPGQHVHESVGPARVAVA